MLINIHESDQLTARPHRAGVHAWVSIYNVAGEEVLCFFCRPERAAAFAAAFNALYGDLA